MKTSFLILLTVCFLTGAVSVAGQSYRSLLRQANESLDDARYDDAESALTELVESASGEILQESLYLLAGLKSSAAEARRLYLQAINERPDSDWAKRSQLELSKIQYALGNYEESLRILEDSRACEVSDEACLFQGLSAVMLEKYSEARRPLSSIRRGRHQAWAYLSLAAVESGLDRPRRACDRYEQLARAKINPTALYRYAECLENQGDVEGASDEYREIIDSFRDTPEAVLASEKLLRMASPVAAEPEPDTTAAPEHGVEVLQSGFTIQFGSFGDRGNAIKLAAKIKRVYPGVRIDSELINYREYHRVRYGYYRTRQEAQAKAEEISREMNEDFTIMTLP
jgi:tetratricopeptide (TPR) repeat protein